MPPHENSLFEHHRIIVDPNQAPCRIDQFLVSRLPSVSRTRIQTGIRQGGVLVNNCTIKSSYRTKPNDLIQVLLPHPPVISTLEPENISLDIIYEDSHLLLVNKEASMVVHPGTGNWRGTLVNALLYHTQQLPCQEGNEIRPGLVHRIDKGTSGLLLVAKSESVLNSLARQFAQHTIQRTYIALVWGILVNDEGTIDKSIARSPFNRKIMAICKEDKGKKSITHYKVLERFSYVTLIECQLETGRTHQIRVHMNHIGHPLFGDPYYGGDRILKGKQNRSYRSFIQNCFRLLSHQALHAKSLGFWHPVRKENLYFETPLPPNFAALLKKWQSYIA